PELRQGSVGAVDQALEIDVDDAGMVLDGNIPEEAERADADIVDPDVDGAETVERSGAQPCDVFGIADIDGQGDGHPAAVVYLFGQFLQYLQPTRGDDHVGSDCGQSGSCSSSEAAGGSRHDDGLSSQLSGRLLHGFILS